MPQFEPSITGFGTTMVATTPAETLWNEAFAKAKARIENPRWEGLGTQVGGIDSPENVNQELFGPLQQRFFPEQMMARMPKPLTELDKSLILNRQAERENEVNKLNLAREKQVATSAFQQAESQRKLNEFNARSSRLNRVEATAGEKVALRYKADVIKNRIKQAQAVNDTAKELAAIAELDALFKQHPEQSSAPSQIGVPDVTVPDVVEPDVSEPQAPEMGATNAPAFQPPENPSAALPPAAAAPVAATMSNEEQKDALLAKAQHKLSLPGVTPAQAARIHVELERLLRQLGYSMKTNAPAVPTNDVPAMPFTNAPAPTSMTATNAPETNAAPVNPGLGIVDYANQIRQKVARGEMREEAAAKSLSDLEAAVKTAYVARRMNEQTAITNLLALGYTKAEAYSFLMDEGK